MKLILQNFFRLKIVTQGAVPPEYAVRLNDTNYSAFLIGCVGVAKK